MDQTTKPEIYDWVNRNSLSSAAVTRNAVQTTEFSSKRSAGTYTTVSVQSGKMSYSNEDIQFENCMCEFCANGKLKDSSFGICMSLISTGSVDIDHRLTLDSRYINYTLLGIAMDTNDMEKAIELIRNGADPCVGNSFSLSISSH